MEKAAKARMLLRPSAGAPRRGSPDQVGSPSPLSTARKRARNAPRARSHATPRYAPAAGQRSSSQCATAGKGVYRKRCAWGRGAGQRRHRTNGPLGLTPKRRSRPAPAVPESSRSTTNRGSSPAANRDKRHRIAAGDVRRGWLVCWRVRLLKTALRPCIGPVRH